jgi:prepilin-type N-terminal cleavage/methylation domain-containing protein/prepilin-type processing-associated H-X9-DG protein
MDRKYDVLSVGDRSNPAVQIVNYRLPVEFKSKIANRQSQIRASAFTLVELLVVIGIITILMAILLTALSKARRQADRIYCASNMRQIGIALISYANDHKVFPPSGTARGWLAWEKSDTLTIQDSLIVPYLGGRFKPELFLCPNDPGTRRRLGIFPYSYTVNLAICDGSGSKNPVRINQIKDPSQKILFIDESAATIRDDRWFPMSPWVGPRESIHLLSVRHDRNGEYPEERNPGRGNVIFADGHHEFFWRGDTFDPKYQHPRWPKYGNID